jgi:hypothetical protein
MAAASAADKRRMLADLATNRRRGDRGSFLGRAAAALAVGVAVLLVILWFAGWFSAPPALREIRALVDEQIAVLDQVARNEVPMTEASFTPVLERMREVPREHREQVRGEIERLFEARETAEINSYFALAPQQRRAELDHRIRAEQERRQAREASRERENAAGRGPQPTAAQSQQSQTPRRSSTEEERNLRRKASIDRTTPEQRARRAEYRRVMQERREQLAASAGR